MKLSYFTKKQVLQVSKLFLWYFLSISLLNFVIYFNFLFNIPTAEQITSIIRFNDGGIPLLKNMLYLFLVQKSFIPALYYTVPSITLHLSLLYFLDKLTKIIATANSTNTFLSAAKPTIHFFTKTVGFLIKKMPLIIFIVAIIWEIKASNVLTSVQQEFTSLKADEKDYFAENYLHPKNIKITPPKNKKNLITIFIDALEAGYTNEAIFGENILHSITSISNIPNLQTAQFKSLKQLLPSERTTGGTVASLCATPFLPYLVKNKNRTGRIFDLLLPGATCVSDVLKKFGYKNVYMLAEYAEFGGILNFIKAHSFDEYYDKHTWLASAKYTEKDFNHWGLHDDNLADEVILKIDQLEKEGNPYNFFSYFIGMHGPYGYPSKECIELYGDTYMGTVKCTMAGVRKIVDHIIAKGYIDNAQIFIAGDHLAGHNPGKTILVNYLGEDDGLKRDIFNIWLGRELPNKNTDAIVQYDIAPALLELIGFKVENKKFGLGYSPWGDQPLNLSETRTEELQKHSYIKTPSYINMWLPKTRTNDVFRK